MKKFAILLLCLLALFLVVGCASDGESNPASPKDPKETKESQMKTQEEEPISFTYKGTKISMGVDATDILENLGKAKSVTEEASCAFVGMDKTYFYGSVYITTYPNGDKENIYGAWFVDDSVTTDENIYIGASKSEVEAAYGADSFDGSAYVITKGNSKLTIIVEDDAVTGITYDAIVE